jgi:hypothetical protein
MGLAQQQTLTHRLKVKNGVYQSLGSPLHQDPCWLTASIALESDDETQQRQSRDLICYTDSLRQ